MNGGLSIHCVDVASGRLAVGLGVEVVRLGPDGLPQGAPLAEGRVGSNGLLVGEVGPRLGLHVHWPWLQAALHLVTPGAKLRLARVQAFMTWAEETLRERLGTHLTTDREQMTKR